MEQAVNLFGSFDENIHLIESEFGVTVANREGELRVNGEPEDVILLDATRGNEAMGVILVYKNFLVVEGRRLDKSAITDVTFNNSGTPYARDEYQVIIATNIPEIGYIHVKAGYDVAWTKGVAEEIRKNLAEVFSNKK